jgi:hypothetical protein
MLRLIPTLALISLAALVETTAWSQESSCLRRTLPLTLENAQGFPLDGLSTADVETKFPAAGTVKVLSIVPDERPHRIVILVDASGSMATKWGEVLAPALGLAETALPNTKMALLIFKDKVEEQISFSQGQDVIAERLRQIRSMAKARGQTASGRTALFGSLFIGLQLLETPTSADTLYLISDGADNTSHARFRDVAQRLSASGVRLFVSLVVGQYGNRSPTSEEVNGPLDIGDLVRKTGGKINTPFGQGVPTKLEEAQRLSQAMQRFYAAMAQNYRLEVELPTTLDKPTSWELRFSEEGKSRWKNARVNYPTQLAACSR